MFAYTDYPACNDDYSRNLVPVWVTDYDGDKYVTVIRQGSSLPEEIKQGYVYRSSRRVPFRHSTLERKFGDDS